MKNKILAAKKTLIASCLIASSSYVCATGIPVLDAAGLSQNTVTAIEAVVQTQQQIEQYATQLLQYENMLKNTVAPASWIWDQANDTINNLLAAQDTLSRYEAQYGNLDAFLGKYKDLSTYRSSPCYSSTGCSQAEWDAMKIIEEQDQEIASEARKAANDSLAKTIHSQQSLLQEDADRLRDLQNQAQTAEGQLAAIGYANQIASASSSQLMQIRSLLIASHNAELAKLQAESDEDARQKAWLKKNSEGSFTPTNTAAPSLF